MVNECYSAVLLFVLTCSERLNGIILHSDELLSAQRPLLYFNSVALIKLPNVGLGAENELLLVLAIKAVQSSNSVAGRTKL